MRVDVKFGSTNYPVEVPDGSDVTFAQLKDLIHAATGVLPQLQKLLGKPNLQTKPDTTLLSALGIKAGTKLMLIGSTAEDIVKANAPSETPGKANQVDAGTRLLRSLPLNFWMMASFGGVLGDPYVSGKGEPLEGGSALFALLSLDVVLSRINTLGASAVNPTVSSTKLLEALGQEGAASVSHRFLTSIPAGHRAAIQKTHAVVRNCYRFTEEATAARSPGKILEVVEHCLQRIDLLPLHEWLMVPSGWIGAKSYNIMYLLLYRCKPDAFSVVVVNRGAEGQDYHPRWQTAEKVTACPLLRFDEVDKSRLQDRAFWLLLLSLWMRSNDPANCSEFVRAEVFYDVLLPWLVEKSPTGNHDQSLRRFATEVFLSVPQGPVGAREAAEEVVPASSSAVSSDPFCPFIMEHGATPTRSASSAIKSAITAFCFLLEQYGGMQRADIKRVKFVLKYEFFMRAAEDLSLYARRFLPAADGTAVASGTPSVSSGPTVAASPACLRKALADLKEAGVEEGAFGVSLTTLFEEAKRQNIVIKNAKSVILSEAHFAGKTVLVYVGGLQMPGGKQLTTLVADAAQAIMQTKISTATEFIFLSADESPEMYDEHAALLPCARAGFPCVELIQALEVTRAPQIMVFTPAATGQSGSSPVLLHCDGVQALRVDPEAVLFPDGPWRGAVPLSATDVRMLEVGAAQLAHHTRKRAEQSSGSDSGAGHSHRRDTNGGDTLAEASVRHVTNLVEAVAGVVACLPRDSVHDTLRSTMATTTTADTPASAENAVSGATAITAGEAEKGERAAWGAAVSATLAHTTQVTECSFGNVGLLPLASTAAYYGKAFHSSIPAAENMSDLVPARSYAQLHTLLSRSEVLVEALWAKSRHSGTASRVAVQLHIIEFVTWLFTVMIPVPLPPPSAAETPSFVPIEEEAVTSDFYTTDGFAATEGDPQAQMLRSLYFLMLSYTNAWQAVETPTRAFDSERCLIAMDMLLVFDAVLRQERGSKQGLMMAIILKSDGGYRPSTSLGRAALPFATIAATLELTKPQLLPIRSAVLRYVRHQAETLSNELFDLRMPDKLELRKGSCTVTFLRTFLDNEGFSIDDAGPMVGNSSEMDKLMIWLCGSRSPLAEKHPEFMMLRDMVLLAKFLGTMEPRDSELLHRRKEMDPLASWRIAFEEDAPGKQMSAGWRTRPLPPKWECVMVRGRDVDIADIIVKGFGDREVMYGDGLVLHSPIDVSRLIEVDQPTEDDVLHAQTLPTFGGTVSPEEAEMLLSCLTTPYIRIPLILDFFSSQDRNTYLFVPEVQAILRAVLFEPATYVSPEEFQLADPRSVPMRLNRQQKSDLELRRLRGDLEAKDNEQCLGTTYGLLLNEIAHAPAAVLHPLQRILSSLTELGPSSVYSANASYVLFVVGLVCDVLAYCRFVQQQQHLVTDLSLVVGYHAHVLDFLNSHVHSLLAGWLREAEANSDTPTQCVLFSYRGMIDRALWKGYSTLAEAGHHGAAPSSLSSSPLGDPKKHLVQLLQSSAFVRARHGFGMGMQRTQLAAQEGDAMLTPEEKLLRFLQAQGLDTSSVSKDMLEQGKHLMLSGGRRRAIFVQVRSRFHSDTVRVPNLFHSDAKSTTESKALKLPPADVPENVLFSYLLEDNHTIVSFLDAATEVQRGSVLQSVVQAVLRDHPEFGEPHAATRSPSVRSKAGSMSRSQSVVARASAVNLDAMDAFAVAAQGAMEEERWTASAPGVYAGPASSGLLFHAHTCELFWRNDELKPVPDSMSHFTDFENVLGREILQCGLVSRHEHRHWVHIVGTPYDVVEWTAPPEIANQGVHRPLIIQGNFPEEMVESAVFEGVTYDRIVDMSSDDPWPVREERWAVEMVREVLAGVYPSGMKFFPLAPALPSEDGAEEEGEGTGKPASRPTPYSSEMRFLMNDASQYEEEKERATWKEVVAYRNPRPHFHIFNLVPHARKLYRSLVFSTNQRLCLHSLALLMSPRTRDSLAHTAFVAGEAARRVQHESTLEIHRFNPTINGREIYIPPRLLQGLVPGALLEAFFFWQGEDDDVLRGYPFSEESATAPGDHAVGDAPRGINTEMLDHWFAYSVEVYVGVAADGSPACTVVRRDDKSYTHAVPLSKQDRNRVGKGRQLLARAGISYCHDAEEVDAAEAAAPFHPTLLSIEPAVSDSNVSLVHAALLHLPREVCRDVLVHTENDIAGAIQWASDPANGAELQGMVAQHLNATLGEGEALVKREDRAGAPLKESDLVLMNLLGCRHLAPLMEMLTSLEDCSHILVWGRVAEAAPVGVAPHSVAGTSGEQEELSVIDPTGRCLAIDFIELPRLRAKFYTQIDSATRRKRLFLADQPGWRIAEADDFSADRRARLQCLRDAFQQCVVLCNSAHEAAFMVPNHDFTFMQIAGDPFTPLLLFNRCSFAWQESVPSPFYLYAVHPSNAFLLPPTLSASLYCAVMQCATQQYAGALRTLESCYTDSRFSPEEAFMFALFDRTVQDEFPDAHAVRLKLAHAVQYSSNVYNWSLPLELVGYLSKKRHVSADCQLRRSVLVELLKRCTKALPLVRAQLELYAAFLKRSHHDSGGEGQTEGLTVVPAAVHAPAIERCGFPWERMLLYPWERISPQKLKRVTYKAPADAEMVNEELVSFLWKDELLMDEESGANTKKGFYFLYSMKRKTIRPRIAGKNFAGSFSELLSRWFHLRHARWGREAQEGGEQALAPSWCAVVLQLMELFPTADWPATIDPSEAHQLSHGVNLSIVTNVPDDSRLQRTQRQSKVPQDFDRIHRTARELFSGDGVIARIRERSGASQRETQRQRQVRVPMFDHVRSRVLAQDTAMSSIILRETELAERYFSSSTEGNMDPSRARHRTLVALCTEPLSELGMTGALIAVHAPAAGAPGVGAEEINSAGGTLPRQRLPFELRQHPLARAPLAQNMLDRLEEDSAQFTRKQRNATRYSLPCLAPDRVEHILVTAKTRAEAETSLGHALRSLRACAEQLFALSARDTAAVAQLSESVLRLANAVDPGRKAALLHQLQKDTAGGTGDGILLDHVLQRVGRVRVPVPLEWICGGLLSTQLEAELTATNPFHGSVEQLRAETVLLMLMSNRGFFAEQSALAVQNILLFLELCEMLRGGGEICLSAPASTGTVDSSSSSTTPAVTPRQRRERIEELMRHFSLEIEPTTLLMLLRQQEQQHQQPAPGSPLLTLPDAATRVIASRLQQLIDAALDLLTMRRHYVRMLSPDSGSPVVAAAEDMDTPLLYELDPRFLLFEFLFNILLRARQVEMVRWFVANIREGQSRVQQMIMGQGKTTVVGPLLALILADGSQLVTQVMPTALLEQTRGILRRCFGVVLVKHIYTLQFDRSFDDDAGDDGIELIYQKLKSAEEDRSVVIAAPECIKSLFLKGIEQLHMMETIETSELNAESSADERYASHAQVLRQKTIVRAHVADAITPILQLWKRGVLIMDEVDVLLHPLRSELNFPIGLKHPIDMTGPRWLLPIHLLDAVFYFHRGRACQDTQQLLKMASTSLGDSGDETSGSAAEAERQVRRQQVLTHVSEVVAEGFRVRALQREPHLVLLDTDYYRRAMLPALVPWLQLWLHEQVLERLSEEEVTAFEMREFDVFASKTASFLLSPVKADPASTETSAHLNTHLTAHGLKLVNLGHDWLHRLLPHVLAKIDRVSFGVLQPADLALSGSADRIPYSRRMMAVPFVAKDVPSRSSEFAHPDVVIGLTVLAFRYEGLRSADVRSLITQLKQDFARQAGPKEHRPAARLYRYWLRLSATDKRVQLLQHRHHTGAATVTTPSHSSGGGGHPSMPAVGTTADAMSTFEHAGVPLSQLQVTDRAQMTSLHQILHRVPEVVHYYLCSCVFPRTMNFQSLKISACGHELGSSMLFTKRIGFSGTPSNLLPLDLGECFYEPGSDGLVLHMLTNKDVVRAQTLSDDWTPLKVLDRIAAAQPSFSALIDAGALITNMDNQDVARYLLARLPAARFDGVVFLDNRDRQMILQRDNGLIVPVAQCGVPLSRRFTFFDQVHTTGTDVKQSATAVAAITLGKDLVFRDYAQAAYRMRGIGKGQRLCLYLIPEVVARITDTLTPRFKTGDILRDVPAWLLLNSMRIEGLQFFKLSLQELANVWRKKAVNNLVAESAYANEHPDLFTGYLRCRRFHLTHGTAAHMQVSEESQQQQLALSVPNPEILRASIKEFREVIEFPVATRIEVATPFLDHVTQLIAERPDELLQHDAASRGLVRRLLEGMSQSVRAANETHAVAGEADTTSEWERARAALDFNAEVVHEQEAEEEQEQEAEQEEQRISAFSRDDEFQVPWGIDTLRSCGKSPADTVRPANGCCFYQLNCFQIRPAEQHRPQQAWLQVSERYLLSDNFFRLDWHGVGERRLKNAFVVAEWIPLEQSTTAAEESTNTADRSSGVCAGLVTLAEGESLRWLLHHSAHVRGGVCVALRFVSTGRYMDMTALFSAGVPRAAEAQRSLVFSPEPGSISGGGGGSGAVGLAGSDFSMDPASLLYRFFNNDMFFSQRQLSVLESVLYAVPEEERLQFFVECLRVRRRHRNHWEDAPIAALFVRTSERRHLRQLAAMKHIQQAFAEMAEALVRVAVGPPRVVTRALRAEAQRIEAGMNALAESLSAYDTGTGVVRASVVAGCLMDAFPHTFARYSTFDLEQALLFIVAKQSNSDKASVSSSPLPMPDHGTESSTVELSFVFKAFPLLDQHHIHNIISAATDAARLSGMAGVDPDVPWGCEQCTYHNDLSSTVCAMCMASRPGAPKGGAATADGTTAQDAMAGEDDCDVDAPWQCETCTFINDSRSQPLCSICLAPNPHPLVDKSGGGGAAGSAGMAAMMGSGWDCPEGYWVCSVEHGGCSKFNPNALFYCQVCERARPNLASIRF